jgi:AsmA protein
VRLRSKRGWIFAAGAVVLALFVIRPGAGHLRTRIENSVGAALQRRVEISYVHIHLLPAPGFDLDGFVVHDDPAFGAEPVLRAQEVTALLRLGSLVRGRMEISRLSLTEPSLNLVRRDDGRWNIENFLERTAQIAVAPTGKAGSEPRPAFPYIEADRGRINFKFGAEKKPYAITDAKYAFWQESENTWGMRLRGQPVRSDLNLSDTGQIKVSGSWQRAARLYDTPIQFAAEWDGGQLGQLSKFVSGADRGWRGTVNTSVEFVGTPANLLVRSDGLVQDFRRYDIASSNALDLKTHCEAHYGVEDRSLRQIFCLSPVGDGSVSLTGDASNQPGPPRYHLHISANRIPVQSVVAMMRRAKKDLPSDLQADGRLEGLFDVQSGEGGQNPVLEGEGRATDLLLHSESDKADFVVDAVPFSLATRAPANKKSRSRSESIADQPKEAHLRVGPFPLKLARSGPAYIQGWIARSGYSISVKGDADVRRILQLARLAGLQTIHPTATGSAKLDLQMAGPWSGFAAPTITGMAELHAVEAEIRGLNRPLEISTAKIALNDAETSVEGISALAAGTRWSGSLAVPRRCGAPCPVKFNLHADEISTDRLNEWLNPNPPARPWYRFSSSAPPRSPSFLAEVKAAGTLAADRVVIRNFPAEHASAKVELERGQVRVSDARADVLGGKHRGDWRVDFMVKPPVFLGTGTLDSAALSQLADAMHQNWVAGTASAKYQVEMAGLSAEDLLNSAKADLHFTMRDGSFPRVLVSSAPLHVRRFTGTLTLRKGDLELQQATLESPTATYTVTGKVSESRKLDLKLVPEGSAGLTITGTLAEPRVAAIRRAETQAALKP